MLKPPNVERNLVEQNLSTKAVYELPFKDTMENKLKCFQYKVVHNILPTNSNLHNIGTQGVQELFFFVNKKPLEVANGAYQSIVKP